MPAPDHMFELNEKDRKKYQAVTFMSRSRQAIHLTHDDIDAIEIALRVLFLLDKNSIQKQDVPVIQLSELELETIGKIQIHLRKVRGLLGTMSRSSIDVMAIYMSLSMQDSLRRHDKGDLAIGLKALEAVYEKLTMIASLPRWFDGVIAGINKGHNVRNKDRWLFFTLDEICSLLKKRDVVVTRNPDSAPFGLLLDTLRIVRPGITAAQIDTYLQITRKGIGKFSFGRRWGEIADDLPKTEMELS